MHQIHKEGGVVNRFLTARGHFGTPWSERTHCMENGQSVSFSRLTRLRVRLLRHALPISSLILRKKPTVLQSNKKPSVDCSRQKPFICGFSMSESRSQTAPNFLPEIR